MEWKQLESGQLRTFVLVFEPGDELMEELSAFTRERGLSAASFTGVGAFSDLVLGFFVWQRKNYRRLPIREQVEVLSLTGSVAIGDDGAPHLRPYVVIAAADYIARGGHLLEAHVYPTLEVIVNEAPLHLHRRLDPNTGLALVSAVSAPAAARGCAD